MRGVRRERELGLRAEQRQKSSANVREADATADFLADAAASVDDSNFEASVVRFRREKWNIRISPDVKLVKAGLFVMHPVRYLGELRHCKA